jgi:Uma2 family endonuclease
MSTIPSTMTTTLPPDPGWIPSPPYRVTLEQYERMVDEGIFNGRDRVHLINGILVAKMSQNDPHCTADDLCGAALQRIIPPGWYIRVAKPIRLPSRSSKPEPDRCVVRGTIRDYSRRTPEPADIGLVVEIADSSLAEDRKMATEVYGPAGLPVYWIVNLVHRQVEVYTDPGPEGYRSRVDFLEGQAVPVMIDGRHLGEIAVDDILPPLPIADSNGD